MKVLGIGDGPDASAVLAIDDRIVAAEPQAAFDGRPRSRAFPWAAVDDVLRRWDVDPREIDEIAVAGRFTPPFFLRRNPGLRRVARDGFSVTLDLTIFYQAMLRQTGLGALEADRAAEWLERQFRKGGFRGRILLVDIHTALANTAYRSQALDDLLLVTLHPMGDGVSLAVHRAAYGQVDRVFEQRGFSSLHVHMRRCAEAIGMPDARAMWGVAGRHADPDLVRLLAKSLRPLEGYLSRNSYPFPERGIAYDALRKVPLEVAAASVLENLMVAVRGVVARHVRQYRIPRIALAGEVFESTRVVSAIAEIDGVESVSCPSEPGFGALAWGAAAHVAGLPMHAHSRHGADDFSALGGQPVDWGDVARVIVAGGRVAYISGRSGLRDWDDRVILTRADRGSYIPGQRVLWSGRGPGSVPASIRPALRNGAAAAEMDADFCFVNPSAAATDGRVRLVPIDDGVIGALLQRLAASDLHTLRSTRLTRRGCPVARGPEALEAAREAGVDLLVAGQTVVRL